MADPRELKKYYMKVFHRNMAIYKEFLKLYDQAKKEGARFPEDVAWVRFREQYIDTDEGWVRRV